MHETKSHLVSGLLRGCSSAVFGMNGRLGFFPNSNAAVDLGGPLGDMELETSEEVTEVPETPDQEDQARVEDPADDTPTVTGMGKGLMTGCRILSQDSAGEGNTHRGEDEEMKDGECETNHDEDKGGADDDEDEDDEGECGADDDEDDEGECGAGEEMDCDEEASQQGLRECGTLE